MPEPHLRASDADRAAVAAVLGQHMSAGRLNVEEYDERLASAYAARTYGELAELTADLPATDDGRTPERVGQQGPQPAPTADWYGGPWAHAGGWGSATDHAWRAWATTAGIVLSIWLITSIASTTFLYFWPIWVIGPWGAVLVVQTLANRSRGDDGDRRQLPG